MKPGKMVFLMGVLLSPCFLFGQIPANNLPLRIGADQSGENKFQGEIAAVRLYDRALNPAELSSLAKSKPTDSASAMKPAHEWLLNNLPSNAIVKGSLWVRFGKLEIETAPRRRTAGLVAVGIDRLVLPMTEHRNNVDSTAAIPTLQRFSASTF